MHSEVGRRIITTGGDRPNNSRNNSHRDLYGSPAQSPGSENLPNTPGRMNQARSKGMLPSNYDVSCVANTSAGRMHDYFSRDHSRRSDQGMINRQIRRPIYSYCLIDGSREREWSQSDSDKGPENGQEEITWGGANRDTVGSFDSDGVFRIGGGSNGATSGVFEDGKTGRDWQSGFDSNIAKDSKRRGYGQQQQHDEISRDAFSSAGQLRGSPFSDGISSTLGHGIESAHTPSAFSTEADFRDALATGSKPPSAYKWFYRDPQGNVQGPFEAQEMQGWYKSGFFTPTLLVKREDDVQFEPLISLIRRVGNDVEPFLISTQPEARHSPASSHAAGLNLGLGGRPRALDPFNRPSPSANPLLGGSIPLDAASGNLFGSSSAASDILSPGSGGFDFSGKYNALGGIGGGVQSSFLQQQLGQGPGTPQSPSLLQSPFGGSFGPNFLGSHDGASPWGERPRTLAWLNNGQSEMYGAAESPGISSLLQRQQQQHHGLNSLFSPSGGSPGYMDYQRSMNDHMSQHQQYLQMLQHKQQQHLQFQQQLQQQLQQQALESANLSPHSPQASTLGQGAFAADQGIPQSLETENRRVQASIPMSATHSGWGSAPGTPITNNERPVASLKQSSLVDQPEATSVKPAAAATEEDKNDDALVQSMTKATIDEPEPKPATEPSPKAPVSKAPSVVNKPVSLREIQAEELRKQQEAKLQQQQQQQLQQQQQQLQQQQQQQEASKAAAAASKENATTSAAVSGKSGWGSSPWGLESTTKGPSLREIQEMEAKEAEARKQAEAQQAANAASRIASANNNVPWGVTTSNKSTPSASTSTSTPAWGTTTAPKKTLREIQQEEEEAALRRAKAQQQAAANASSASSAAAAPVAGRGYAGIAENAALKTSSSGAGWTTVTAQRTPSRVATSPPHSSSNVTRSTSTQNAWETVAAPKQQSPSVQQQQQATSAASRPMAATTNTVKSTKAADGNKPPSEDFCRWCRQSLRGLNPGVNGRARTEKR